MYIFEMYESSKNPWLGLVNRECKYYDLNTIKSLYMHIILMLFPKPLPIKVKTRLRFQGRGQSKENPIYVPFLNHTLENLDDWSVTKNFGIVSCLARQYS